MCHFSKVHSAVCSSGQRDSACDKCTQISITVLKYADRTEKMVHKESFKIEMKEGITLKGG